MAGTAHTHKDDETPQGKLRGDSRTTTTTTKTPGSDMGSGRGNEGGIQTKDKLVGAANFKRVNPLTDRSTYNRFHHIELYCGDATNTAKRFGAGLGMKLVAKSDNTTGNHSYASYVLKSNELTFVFSAPYAVNNEALFPETDAALPHASFDSEGAFDFFKKHGLAVKAVGLSVADAADAYEKAVANGAVSKAKPYVAKPTNEGESEGSLVVAEVLLYGDVHLRFVSGGYAGPFLPGYAPVESPDICYGLHRLDHCVGNVPNMLEAYNYIVNATGFHEFAEFTAEDVGTVDSGLNSIVAASNNEMILFPINEPTFGTKRKSQVSSLRAPPRTIVPPCSPLSPPLSLSLSLSSRLQIQTYLEQNNGAGVQHMALKTDDIFKTLRHMREVEHVTGFELMPRPSEK